MLPLMAANAPTSATAAYTMLLTNRVPGLVSDEKKVARREYPASF